MNKKISIEDYFSASGKDKNDRKNIGWFCTYAPEELMLAGGFDSMRLMGEKKLKTSESYFPINFCPYLKSGWESLISAGNRLSAVVFTNSCDGMRRLYDIAEHYLKDIPIFMLDVPRNTDRYSVDFYSLKLKGMLAFMEKLKGESIATSDILGAISLCDRKRQELKSLSSQFFGGNGSLDIADYYHIMELSATAEINGFTAGIKSLNEHLKQDTAKEKVKGPRIMIMGNFITEEKLWEMFSGMDMDIVCDDLCISNRYYETTVGAEETGDREHLLNLIAKRYLTKPACMRMAATGKKLKNLKQKVEENSVQGVIFISLKFCDTVLYSFPLIRKQLIDLKIPVLYLEIEYNNFSEGQVKTRMQAFLEMI